MRELERDAPETSETEAATLPPSAHVAIVGDGRLGGSLAAAAEAGAATFSLHPLQTFADSQTDPTGAPCAVAGSDAEALAAAGELATALGMRPFEVPEESRAAYHAAASIASNFLIALEESASQLLEKAGVAGATAPALTPMYDALAQRTRALGSPQDGVATRHARRARSEDTAG